MLRIKCRLIGFLISLVLAPNAAWADYALNMTRGVTKISEAVYDLHMKILWICVTIGIAVFATMFYAIIFHRKSRGAVAAKFHDSTIVEVIWTVVPFCILIAMAIPATAVLIQMDDTSDSDITVKVTGYMWKWRYEYVGLGVNFLSNLSTPAAEIHNKATKNPNYLLEVDRPIVLPINKKIRFLTTSNDVIHSWFVPALAIKKDAIPGFINESWTKIDVPGTYRGQCAELCGARHGYMPIVVEAKTEAEFETWLQEQQAQGKR